MFNIEENKFLTSLEMVGLSWWWIVIHFIKSFLIIILFNLLFVLCVLLKIYFISI